MLISTSGNMFHYKHQAYAHGANLLGKKDDRISKSFNIQFYEMFMEYANLCKTGKLELGDIFVYWDEESDIYLFNMVIFSKFNQVIESALFESINRMYNYSRQHNITNIAMQEIECGKSYLQKSQLISALNPFFQDSVHHITIYS